MTYIIAAFKAVAEGDIGLMAWMIAWQEVLKPHSWITYHTCLY